MERKITLVAFMMATIFSIGLTSTLVYGGNQVQVPVPVFDDNFVHAEWSFIPPLGFPPIETPPDSFESFSSSGLELFDPGLGLGLEDGSMFCDDFICSFIVPNFIDDLDTKLIEIRITFGELPNQGTSHIPTIPPIVTCGDFSDIPGGFNSGILIDGFQTELDQFTWLIECRPNPDLEEISIEREPFIELSAVRIWTTSFDDIPIGGTNIPIDQTALLLAGVQSISMWMIPVVIAGIGIGVFVIKRRN